MAWHINFRRRDVGTLVLLGLLPGTDAEIPLPPPHVTTWKTWALGILMMPGTFVIPAAIVGSVVAKFRKKKQEEKP